MKNENNSPDDIEKRLNKFFQKKTENLKAPSDLWAKLEPRLDERKKIASNDKQSKGIGSWLFGPRLIGVAASVAAVLLVLVIGLVWLTGDNGGNSPADQEIAFQDINPSYEDQIVTSPGWEPNAFPAPTSPAYDDRIVTDIPEYAKGDTGAAGSSGAGFALDTVQRQVISTASISLEVQTVDTAISQIRGIAESLGGRLEQMSSTGGQDSEQASVTIRVPQDQFSAAFDKLKALGKVLSQNLGSEDVTEQFIDLEARLKSAQQEEQSLLSLLSKAQNVVEIITLEKELSQVRSNIESIQGQLNYLKRRVDMATIYITLSTPSKQVGQPPSGSLTVEVHNVSASVSSVKGIVSSVKGELDQVNISENEGKETASLSFKVYRANFDQVIASVERLGEIQQKNIQEGITPKGAQAEPAEKPDAYISLTLIEAGTHGFWTSGNIKAISITGSVLLVALIVFLFMANRAGLLRKRSA